MGNRGEWRADRCSNGRRKGCLPPAAQQPRRDVPGCTSSLCHRRGREALPVPKTRTGLYLRGEVAGAQGRGVLPVLVRPHTGGDGAVGGSGRHGRRLRGLLLAGSHRARLPLWHRRAAFPSALPGDKVVLLQEYSHVRCNFQPHTCSFQNQAAANVSASSLWSPAATHISASSQQIRHHQEQAGRARQEAGGGR